MNCIKAALESYMNIFRSFLLLLVLGVIADQAECAETPSRKTTDSSCGDAFDINSKTCRGLFLFPGFGVL